MADDLLQERTQHSGIFWLTCPANHWNVMFHRKLVSEEATVLDPWIYHRGDGRGKKKGPKPLAQLSGTESVSWFLQDTSKSPCELTVRRAAGRPPSSWRVVGKHGPERKKAALSFHFWLNTAAPVKPFEIPLLKPSVKVVGNKYMNKCENLWHLCRLLWNQTLEGSIYGLRQVGSGAFTGASQSELKLGSAGRKVNKAWIYRLFLLHHSSLLYTA